MERIEFNVDVTKQKLQDLIMIQNNIESIISEIQNLYNSLDEKVWLSQEKTKLDEYLIPYIETEKKEHLSRINNYNDSLRIYADGYGNLINKISGSVNNVL